jgi:hypothetical protein
MGPSGSTTISDSMTGSGCDFAQAVSAKKISDKLASSIHLLHIFVLFF